MIDMNKWNSRKFWVAVGVFVVATALLVIGKIDAGVWQWAAGGSVIAYLGSQGITDALAALRK